MRLPQFPNFLASAGPPQDNDGQHGNCRNPFPRPLPETQATSRGPSGYPAEIGGGNERPNLQRKIE